VRIKYLVAAGIAVLALAGCAKAREPFQDAPTADRRNSAPAQVIEFPDGFSNMAGKCDGPNYVYSSFHGNANRTAIAVVPNDPRCKAG